ncbi:MAG: hypothetical protein ACRD0A_12505 [Acidimicrobiales bacterium]
MASDGDVLERVRAAAAWVARKARHVLIDHERLWRRGGRPRYKAVPRPRCRTTAY